MNDDNEESGKKVDLSVKHGPAANDSSESLFSESLFSESLFSESLVNAADIASEGLSSADKALLDNLFRSVDSSTESVKLVRAPLSVRKKLRAIADENHRSKNLTRWNIAPLSIAASIAAMVFVGAIYSPDTLTPPISNNIDSRPTTSLDPEKPTNAEIRAARKELATAFHYLSLAGNKTRISMKTDIKQTIRRATLNSILTLFKKNSKLKEINHEKTS
jgi:hypothetical protein